MAAPSSPAPAVNAEIGEYLHGGRNGLGGSAQGCSPRTNCFNNPEAVSSNSRAWQNRCSRPSILAPQH